MRRAQHGSQSGNGTAPETDFNFGYFYRTIEEHVNAFAAQASNPLAVADIADRVGELLRLKAKNLRTQLGAAELLQQMRENGTSAGGRTGNRAGIEAREALYVRPRTGRTLSDDARASIAEAQRKRWRLHKRAERERLESRPVGRPSKFTLQRPANWKNLSKGEKQQWYYRRAHPRTGASAATPGYNYKGKHWTQQPENKARVRKLAKARSSRQSAPVVKMLPKGYWQAETAKLLHAGPKSRADVTAALRRAAPGKENAITVALATMKRHKVIAEQAGVFTLLQASA